MPKFCTYFKDVYSCPLSKTTRCSEVKLPDGSTIVQGECECNAKSFRWKHTIDKDGKVIDTKEEGSPCSPKERREANNKGESVKKKNGIRVGNIVAISVSVIGVILLVVGIILWTQYHKKEKAKVAINHLHSHHQELQ